MPWNPAYKGRGEARVRTTVTVSVADYELVVENLKHPVPGTGGMTFSDLLEQAIKTLRRKRADAQKKQSEVPASGLPEDRVRAILDETERRMAEGDGGRL